MNNARLNNRVLLSCEATVTLLDETILQAWTIDLSHGGVSLRTAGQVRLAQLCAVRFEIPLGDGRHAILAMGQVVYSDPDQDQGGAFRTGVKFIKVDADSARDGALLRYVGVSLSFIPEAPVQPFRQVVP